MRVRIEKDSLGEKELPQEQIRRNQVKKPQID